MEVGGPLPLSLRGGPRLLLLGAPGPGRGSPEWEAAADERRRRGEGTLRQAS